MTTNGIITTAITVEGVISARNERGIKLDGDWLNASKFRPLDLPAVGTRVRATVDHKGFLVSIEVLDEHTSATASLSQRDRTITRLAVLKAAVTFLSTKPEARSKDVIQLAEVFEHWVMRADGE